MDALDAYMSAIKSGVMDTKTKMKLKRQLLELKKEEQKLQRMVNVAKPAALPDLKRFKISYTHFICQHMVHIPVHVYVIHGSKKN